METASGKSKLGCLNDLKRIHNIPSQCGYSGAINHIAKCGKRERTKWLPHVWQTARIGRTLRAVCVPPLFGPSIRTDKPPQRILNRPRNKGVGWGGGRPQSVKHETGTGLKQLAPGKIVKLDQKGFEKSLHLFHWRQARFFATFLVGCRLNPRQMTYHHEKMWAQTHILFPLSRHHGRMLHLT